MLPLLLIYFRFRHAADAMLLLTPARHAKDAAYFFDIFAARSTIFARCQPLSSRCRRLRFRRYVTIYAMPLLRCRATIATACYAALPALRATDVATFDADSRRRCLRCRCRRFSR